MEQRTIDGYPPLAPPTAEVARGCLAAAADVERRREARIDRRALGWATIAEGASFAVFFTVWGLLFLSSSGIGFGSNLSLLVVFVAIRQLLTERRLRYGCQALLRGADLRWCVIGVVSTMIAFAILMAAGSSGAMLIWIAALVPGAAMLSSFVAPARRQFRLARLAEASPAVALRPFTGAVRALTVAFGIFLGGLVASVGAPDTVAAMATLVAMFVLVAWSIALQIDGVRLPLLGTAWRPRQWALLYVSFVVLSGLLLLRAWAGVDLMLPAAVAGGAMAAAFALSTVGVRDA